MDEAGTTNDINALHQIYHDDMRIHMIDTDDNMDQHDKPGFIAMLEGMIDVNRGASNTLSPNPNLNPKEVLNMKFAIFLATLALGASGTLADTPAQDSLRAVNNTFNVAAAAGDADALTNLYVDDTLWIAQGTPVSQGLAGPRQLFEFVIANKGHVTHTIDPLFVSKDETLAVMIGSVEAVVESVGMDATGTYLFVLEPNDEGWDIVTDMWHQHVVE